MSIEKCTWWEIADKPLEQQVAHLQIIVAQLLRLAQFDEFSEPSRANIACVNAPGIPPFSE